MSGRKRIVGRNIGAFFIYAAFHYVDNALVYNVGHCRGKEKFFP